MQSLSSKKGRGSIHGISNNGVAHGGGVPSDLMCPSRVQFVFHKRSTIMNGPATLAQVLEVCTRLLAFQWHSTQALNGKTNSCNPCVIRLVHERPHPLQHVQCLEVFGEHDRAAGAVVQAMNWVDRHIIRDLIHEARLAPSMGGDARFFEDHKVVFVGIQNVHDRVLFGRRI